MRSVWTCVCVFFTFGAAQILDLYEGDICRQTGSTLWSCKFIKDCPKAQAELKANRRPTTCNFIGSEQLVCCEPDIVRPAPRVSKSKEMCKKYGQSVYVEMPNGAGGITTVDTCAAVEPLITKGKAADPREYPHMALIGYGNKNSIQWLCGGSLISERYVLSAAHCTDAGKKGMARWVRLGDYNFRSTNDDDLGQASSVEYEIVERINHPQYKSPGVYHDITLYKLKEDVEFSQYIRPICLETQHTFPKSYAIGTGWGRTEWGGKQSDTLQKVNLTITPRIDCGNAYKRSSRLKNGIIDASQLCAGDDGKDTCKGDSGGPLQLRLKEPYCMYSQIGITSFGESCGGNKPGVYTRVSNYVPWIEGIVWP